LRCVDTCFIIDLLRGVPGARSKAEELDREGGAGIAFISAFELWIGTVSSGARSAAGAALRRVLDRLDILGLDGEAAEAAAVIFRSAQRAGRSIEQNDALVAATCISRGCSALVTRNTRHFEGIRGLKLETY
jgi:predicted nucleic acid-binding protein